MIPSSLRPGLLLPVLPALLLLSCSPHESQAEGGGKKAKAPPLVSVKALQIKAVQDRLPCTSHIEVNHEVTVLSQAAGQVLEVLVEDGAEVSKGQVLFRLDDREAGLNLENAVARIREIEAKIQEIGLEHEEALKTVDQGRKDLEQAETELQRAKSGARQDLTSPKALEEAQLARDRAAHQLELAEFRCRRAEVSKAKAGTELDAARIQKKIQERKLEDFTIRAPIHGVVPERSVKGGEWINVGTKLCQVVDRSRMILNLTRPQREISLIRVGQKVEVRLDAFPDRVFEGRTTLISPVVDRSTGTFKTRVEVADPEHLLLPGMFCRAEVITRESHEALMVPKVAVLYMGELPFAFVAREGRAVRIPIEPGIETRDEVEALNKAGPGAGPAPTLFLHGDRVIVKDPKKVEDGEAIRIQGEPGKDPSPADKEGASKSGTLGEEANGDPGKAGGRKASGGKRDG